MPTLEVEEDVVGGLSLEAVAELYQNGGSVADAVELYNTLENPDEMLMGDER